MPRPRRRVWLIVVVIAVALLLVLAGAAVALGEAVGRPVIERVAAERLAEVLPSGSAEPEVRVEGGPLLLQLLGGALDRVEIRAPAIALGGASADATVSLRGMPIDFEQPLRAASGEVRLDEAALNALVSQETAGSSVSIGDGVLGYTREVVIAGRRIGLSVAFRPEVRDGLVVFVPVSITSVTGDGGDPLLELDLERLVDLTGFTFDVCAAERLPEGVELTGVRVEPGLVTVSVAATGLRLDAESLARPGHCATAPLTD